MDNETKEQKYAMIAHVTFRAKDIKDALTKLGNHFISVAKDPNTPVMFEFGKFQIVPVKEGTESPQTHQIEAQGTQKPPRARLYLPNGELDGNGHI